MASLDSHALSYNLLFHIVYEIQITFIDPLEDGRFLVLGHLRRQVGQATCSFTGRTCDFMRDRCVMFRNLVDQAMDLGITDQQFLDEFISKQIRECYRLINDPQTSNDWTKFIYLRNKYYVNVNGDRELMNRVVRESMDEFERGNNNGMVPATQFSIENMLKKMIMEGENHKCTICLEGIDGGTEVTSMPCKHQFHGECIVRWLKESHYCPICRYEMPTN